MKTRIYFLDNLRTFQIMMVVILHAGLVYEVVLENQWIVIDPVKNNSIGLIRMYLDLFIMFIIFFVSGYFVPISLGKYNAVNFLRSKFKRIMIPWIIAVLTLIPAYKVIFLWSRGLPQEEWFSYFHTFNRAGSDWSVFANHPTQSWLWFLPVLFMFQVAYLVLSRMKVLSIKINLSTAIVLTFFIGLAYSMLISSLELRGWYHSYLLHFQRERLLIYFMAFLLGALCYKLKVFESHKKNKKNYIVANVVLTISLSIFTAVALNLFYNIITPGRNFYFITEFADKLFYNASALLSMLCILYVFLYVFRFNLNKTNRLMTQLNKSSYAVYIIHMIVMGPLAVVLISISIPVMLKYLILVVLTLSISNFLVYVYQRVLQNSLTIKAIAATMFIVGFVVITSPGNGKEVKIKSTQSPNSQSVKIESLPGLHEAVVNGDLNAIQLHIKAGSDLDEKDQAGGSSPLITAAAFGKVDIARALIDAGASVNYKNNEGSTPLHTAAFFCHTEIVVALLANGADKDLKNNSGSTARESVLAPFEAVKGIYDYFKQTFGPMGMELDYEYIKSTRPKIAKLLQTEE